jgi:uncharacterized repeat protein (TIGR03803 family)
MSHGRIYITVLVTLAVTAVIAGNSGNAFAASPAESILYTFQTGGDGEAPYGGLVADHHGNLYGTTFNGGDFGLGTVFKMTPPKKEHGSWTETVIYSFGATDEDGAWPYSGLVIDHHGNLYGTTIFGGNQAVCPYCGTVFMLTAPSSPGGEWTESVLWSFGGSPDGIFPYGTLTMDPKGNLYGTTVLGGSSGSGAVFEVTPSGGGAWNEQVLYNFGQTTVDGGNPFAGVVRNSDGTLYGTTSMGGAYGYGTVYELTKPRTASAWAETVLYSFTGGADGGEPISGVILDDGGRLDGTASIGGNASCGSGCGTVYQLRPPSGHSAAWTMNVLYAFTGDSDGSEPSGGVVRSSGGKLLGTASVGGSANCDGGCGTVYELTPPKNGQSAWTETTLYEFAGGATDGAFPASSLLLTEENGAIGVTTSGGLYDAGTVFRINTH